MRDRIVVLMIVIAFSLNVFAEMVEVNDEDHVCTTECKHEEIKKECGAECLKQCSADKKEMKGHVCDEKCELSQKHVCTSECMSKDRTIKCELASHKEACANATEKKGHDTMNHEEKTKKKGCHQK